MLPAACLAYSKHITPLRGGGGTWYVVYAPVPFHRLPRFNVVDWNIGTAKAEQRINTIDDGIHLYWHRIIRCRNPRNIHIMARYASVRRLSQA